MKHDKDYIIEQSLKHYSGFNEFMYKASETKTIKTDRGFRKVNFFKSLKPEELLQAFVVWYMKEKGFENIIHSFSEGKRNSYQQYKAKIMGLERGVPDIITLRKSGEKIGLVLELKAFNPYKKDGKLKAAIKEEQVNYIETMRLFGFESHFACVDNVYQIIDNYIK